MSDHTPRRPDYACFGGRRTPDCADCEQFRACGAISAFDLRQRNRDASDAARFLDADVTGEQALNPDRPARVEIVLRDDEDYYALGITARWQSEIEKRVDGIAAIRRLKRRDRDIMTLLLLGYTQEEVARHFRLTQRHIGNIASIL